MHIGNITEFQQAPDMVDSEPGYVVSQVYSLT